MFGHALSDPVLIQIIRVAEIAVVTLGTLASLWIQRRTAAKVTSETERAGDAAQAAAHHASVAGITAERHSQETARRVEHFTARADLSGSVVSQAILAQLQINAEAARRAAASSGKPEDGEFARAAQVLLDSYAQALAAIGPLTPRADPPRQGA